MTTIYGNAHLDRTAESSTRDALPTSPLASGVQWLRSTAMRLREARERQRLIAGERERERRNSLTAWSACFRFDPRTDDVLARGDD